MTYKIIVDLEDKKRKHLQKQCEFCKNDFWCPVRFFCKKKYCNKICSSKALQNRVSCQCDYCKKLFLKQLSDVKQFNFCCREHKDLAQRVDSYVTDFNPYINSTSNGLGNYSKRAKYFYGELCEVCGLTDKRILQVHHIDSNRQNHELDNLIVLCPNCHAYCTYGYADIINRKLVFHGDDNEYLRTTT